MSIDSVDNEVFQESALSNEINDGDSVEPDLSVIDSEPLDESEEDKIDEADYETEINYE